MQICYSGTKMPELCENNNFYEDFNMEELDLNIEKYEELFGASNNNMEQFFGSDDIDRLFGIKDISSANRQRGYMVEVHSTFIISILHCPLYDINYNSSSNWVSHTLPESYTYTYLDMHINMSSFLHKDDYNKMRSFLSSSTYIYIC